MRVLLISQHYWPETVGTARRAQLMAEHLAEVGHQVTVLCGRPNHPSMGRYFDSGEDDATHHLGVDIRRLPVYRNAAHHTRSKATPDRSGQALEDAHHLPMLPLWSRANRLTSYGSWLLEGSLTALLKPGRFGVVVAVSPLPTGVIGVIAARRCAAPLIFDVQDIWPDAAVKAGILRNPQWIKSLELLETWVYAHARAILVLSRGFQQDLVARGVPADKVHILPNPVDIRPYERLTRERNILRQSQGLTSEHTLVIYTGNLGMVQDLDILLSAAFELRHVPKIRFLLVGEGVEGERLRRRVEAQGLTQVRFMEPQPHERIPALLLAADVCFLSLRRGSYTPGTVPSKLYEYMAAGKPILNLVEHDAAELISESGAGINLPPGNAAALRVAIFGMHADPGLRMKLGLKGQAFARTRASREVIGAQLEMLLRSLSPH